MRARSEPRPVATVKTIAQVREDTRRFGLPATRPLVRQSALSTSMEALADL